MGRDLDPEVLAQLVTMVDRTTYSDEARTPKIALRQIIGRLGLRQELCKLAADSGLLSIEVVAMLGDTAAAVKATLKTLVDPAALGADEAARELSLMQIATVWACLPCIANVVRDQKGQDGRRSVQGPRDGTGRSR